MGGVVRFTEASSIALHTMTILATRRRRFLTVSELASRLPVSESHLAKVLQRLARAGLVESVRGPGGGFLLRREPAEITLLDVHEAIEGRFDVTACLFTPPGCSGICVLGDTLREANALVHARLARTRLSDLVEARAPRAALVALAERRDGGPPTGARGSERAVGYPPAPQSPAPTSREPHACGRARP